MKNATILVLAVIVSVQFVVGIQNTPQTAQTHEFKCLYFGEYGEPVCDYWPVMPSAEYQAEFNVTCFYFEDVTMACWSDAKAEHYRSGSGAFQSQQYRPGYYDPLTDPYRNLEDK